MPQSFECSLDDLLADPLIQLVMKADKVDAAHIKALYARADGGKEDQFPADKPCDTHMAIYPDQSDCYRSGVGIMLLNQDNKILLGQRLNIEGAWQMPQGGIEEGESPFGAALRELREETGTDRAHLLAVSKGWLRYFVPKELRPKSWEGRWFGQQQKWFALRFAGGDEEIHVETEHPEFSSWRWAEPEEAARSIVAFKRPLYHDVLNEFRHISN